MAQKFMFFRAYGRFYVYLSTYREIEIIVLYNLAYSFEFEFY
jgi:hypothetical protein